MYIYILLCITAHQITKNSIYLVNRIQKNSLLILDLYPSGLTGLEPAASALTGRCSDQLNYNPKEKRVQHTYS